MMPTARHLRRSGHKVAHPGLFVPARHSMLAHSRIFFAVTDEHENHGPRVTMPSGYTNLA